MWTRPIAASLVIVAMTGCSTGDGAAPGDPTTDRPGCGQGVVVDGRPLRIVTTVAPLADIVDTLVDGSGASLVAIVREGTDSHTFEPAPSDAAMLEDADVVFVNGLGLERPTRRLALANMSDGAELCELGTTVLPESMYRFDAAFPAEGGVPNPHLWTSPRWVGEYARLIVDVLAARDPANDAIYTRNLDDFLERVDELDETIRVAVATVPVDRRLLLTYHDAYGYFAADYGLTVVEAVQPSSFGEPSPRDVARLIEQVDELGVATIFGSEEFPSPVLEHVAAATGAIYVDDLRDDELPGEVGDVDHSWFGLMRSNTITIVEGLGGDAASLRELDSARQS
jgi:ABC-type Zn uptake system ZnuABC Zn-binding protein ZnuA